jgi:hypothetical protein
MKYSKPELFDLAGVKALGLCQNGSTAAANHAQCNAGPDYAESSCHDGDAAIGLGCYLGSAAGGSTCGYGNSANGYIWYCTTGGDEAI